MKHLVMTWTILFALALVAAGCMKPAEITEATETAASPGLANPASEYCLEQGGTLAFEKRGDGGDYGICTFEDNRQCEEWALMRGECPVGGLKITGYITSAAQYCVITGGKYAITGNSGADDEQGTCTLVDGTFCDVWDYYNGECMPGSVPTPAALAIEWQTYTNAQAGYSLQLPVTWNQQTLPDQNDGLIHGEGFSGPEGGVEVSWGLGFGGACPTGTETVQLAEIETTTCHITQSDGAEAWNQIYYEVSGGNSFSIRAYTSDNQSSSHDLVLKVLSTLGFMPPEAAAATIQPLSMEVCDGQAQAMAHALDVLEVTQSEEPLSDPISGASGTGCQAAAQGTGAQFESPSAVVTTLGVMLASQNWSVDPMLSADGPTGTGMGYRKGDQICMADAIWFADDSANCPKDQPISTCQVTPEQQLYTVTLNCGVEIAAGQASPASPTDSAQLVFDSTRGGSTRDLYSMTEQGYDLSRLTRGLADSFAGPWSPDGQRIVFTTYGLTSSAIAVINADGSELTVIDQVEGSDEGFPDWSPDGRQIAFTSLRDGNNEIYVMNADGSNPIRLTNHPGDDFAPSWSPDGGKIVFVSDRDREPGIYDLYMMNADGSAVIRLTDDSAIDYSPDWSPDGKKIVFRSHHDGLADIYVISVDGSGLTNLTDDPADDWAPTWSPDGRYIVFQTNRDGNWEIYRMAANGSDPVNLTNDPADDQLPYWRP